MSTEPYYVLNRNEGMDTIHENPREECNVDDADGREAIDAAEFQRLKAGGLARLCRHCIKEDRPQ